MSGAHNDSATVAQNNSATVAQNESASVAQNYSATVAQNDSATVAQNDSAFVKCAPGSVEPHIYFSVDLNHEISFVILGFKSI